MNGNGNLGHEITPAEAYQLDSDEFDSDQERDDINQDEYERLVEEAENGYSDEEMDAFTRDLKEKGLVNFLREYLSAAATAGAGGGEMRSLRKLLLGFGIVPPESLRNPSTPNLLLLPYAKIALSRVLRKRERLSHLSSIDDALSLLKKAKNIIVLSGAGISTSCGIPDFRSANGLYANLQAEGKYELDDPQQMFDIGYFRDHPEVFYSFAKQIYPSNFVPSPCHRWIKMLEDKGKLLRNYTQNIDTLESLAGVTRVLQCHGSFKTASCLRCKTRVPGKNIEPYIMSQQIPYCGACRERRTAELEQQRMLKQAQAARGKTKGKGKANEWDESEEEAEAESEWGNGEPGIIKPDITFFGQALDSEFDECLFKDREEVDLLVIIGTSLKVAPVSEVLTHIPHSVPQIFINLTPVYHVQPDICLLGDADSIVTDLSNKLGWTIPPPVAVPLSPLSPTAPVSPTSYKATGTEAKEEPSASEKDLLRSELEWISGQGEFRHIHRLERPGDEANPNHPNPDPDLDDSDSDSESSSNSNSEEGSQRSHSHSHSHSGSARDLDENENENEVEGTTNTNTNTKLSGPGPGPGPGPNGEQDEDEDEDGLTALEQQQVGDGDGMGSGSGSGSVSDADDDDEEEDGTRAKKRLKT